MYYSFRLTPDFCGSAASGHCRDRQLPGLASSLIAGVLIALGRLILFGMSASSAIAGAGMPLIGIICGTLSRTHWGRLSKMSLMSVSSMLVLLCIMWMNIPDHHKVYTVFTEHLIISMLATVVIYMLTEYINTSNQLFLQLKKNAETDYLTSLHNLRQFERLLSERFLEAQHFSERLGVLVVDIDHFKNKRHLRPCGRRCRFAPDSAK